VQPPAGTESAAADAAAAGRAFEALILAQLLRSARASTDLMGQREAGAEDQWRELAERRTAETLAASSPLGLAQLLARAATTKPSP
jgi:flagellar protein FlgJ